MEDERLVLRMRTILGRKTWQTPVFADTVIAVILNPRWDVPSSIARAEILAQLRKNPDYLRVNNMKVIRGRAEDARVVDPRGIDWSAVDEANLDFAFRQEPGGNNPLGQLKFKLGQTEFYYLHDTPHKALFERTRRTFSHGCLRLEKPLELAGYLLQETDLRNLTVGIDKGIEQTLRLPEPVPLYVFYWTTWVEEDGIVHFREDVYQHDQRLEKLLRT